MRLIIFTWLDYEACGGFGDVEKDENDNVLIFLDENIAVQYVKEVYKKFIIDNVQIVDMDTLKVVSHYDIDIEGIWIKR